MRKFREIVYICNDNNILSPLAEALTRKELRRLKILKGTVRSRGLVVLFPEPVNTKVEEIAREEGIDLSEHTSKGLKETDFADNVLCLVMSSDIKQKIYRSYKEAVNVYTIMEFVGEQGEIKTPFGRELDDYRKTSQELEGLVKKVIKRLYGDEKQ